MNKNEDLANHRTALLGRDLEILSGTKSIWTKNNNPTKKPPSGVQSINAEQEAASFLLCPATSLRAACS